MDNNKLIEFAKNNNMVDFKSAFNNIVDANIANKINTMKSTLASKLFFNKG